MNGMVAEKQYNQKFLFGCSLFGMLMVLACGGLMIFSIYADRQAGQFPDSEVVASHENYSRLPYQFRWDDTYATEEDFRTVYRWYSGRFGLGAESAANGPCVYSEVYQERFLANRYVGVLICETPEQTMVFLNRTTTLNR